MTLKLSRITMAALQKTLSSPLGDSTNTLTHHSYTSNNSCSDSPQKRPRTTTNNSSGSTTNYHHHDSSPPTVLRFSKMTEYARPPTKGSVHAAGYDLYSAYEYTVPSKGKCLVKTDIQIQLPHGCYGRVAPRSGLAHKHFLDVGAGVIDEDYRGNVGVILFNFNDADYQVKAGDRVAQLICERIYYPELQEVAELSQTERGDGGYGSTGKN